MAYIVNYNAMEAEGAEIYTYLTAERLSRILAEKVQNLIKDSIITGQEFNIALSGGSTPRMLFEHMVKSYRNSDPGIWDNVRFYWVDERCVPPDHPESNYRMANETLLRYISHSNDYVFRMQGENDPYKESVRYAYLLNGQVPTVDDLPAFNLILLGMGKDGHTASIFPDQMELLWTDDLCGVGVHPESGQRRITLTGKVICNADHIFFLVTGKDKAKTLARIICRSGNYEEYPAAHIQARRGSLSWFLDDAAASLLD